MPRTSKPKLILTPLGIDAYYDFLGWSGDIDEEDQIVTFTINVAPDTLEQDYGDKISNLFTDIDKEILHLNMFKKLLRYFEGPGVRAEADFYWSEGDLNMRIIIPLSHPKLNYKP